MDTNLMTSFKFLIDRIESHPSWIVAVCPDQEGPWTECRNALVGNLPVDAEIAGRTSRFKNGGMVSLVPLKAIDTFDTDKPFSIAFMGWDRLSRDNEKTMEWKKRAQDVILIGMPE